MSTADSTPIVLHADREHGGIRLVVFLGLFIAYILSFQILGWLIDAFAPAAVVDYGTFLACIGGFPLALLTVWALENGLKRVWHSGLSIEIDEQGMAVQDTRNRTSSHAVESAPSFVWAEEMRLINWYFDLDAYPRGGRERRIDKSWLCLASELQQDETRMSVYSFVPPKDAERIIAQIASTAPFRELNPADVYESSIRSRVGPPTRPTIPSSILHGKDGRYWLAERRRWEVGIELAPEDYETFLDEISAHRTVLIDTTGSEPSVIDK